MIFLSVAVLKLVNINYRKHDTKVYASGKMRGRMKKKSFCQDGKESKHEKSPNQEGGSKI